MDEMFKESPFMYAVASIIIVFVVVQSVFFIVRAWKRGRQIGIPLEDLKNTVTSSALFTIAPAIAILATVLTLAGTLGIVLPWIRLSVIGNLQYEVTAAQAAMESFEGEVFGRSIEDPRVFAAIAWVMTLGSILPLVLLPLFLKTIQKKMGKVNKTRASVFTDALNLAVQNIITKCSNCKKSLKSISIGAIGYGYEIFCCVCKLTIGVFLDDTSAKHISISPLAIFFSISFSLDLR